MRPQGDPSIGKPGRGRGLEDIWQICMRVNIYSKRGEISTSWSRSQDGWHQGTECVWHVGQCIVTGDFGPAAEYAFAEKDDRDRLGQDHFQRNRNKGSQTFLTRGFLP